jgi:RNA polymerase sigma-70 factor, ECF subfamily
MLFPAIAKVPHDQQEGRVNVPAEQNRPEATGCGHERQDCCRQVIHEQHDQQSDRRQHRLHAEELTLAHMVRPGSPRSPGPPSVDAAWPKARPAAYPCRFTLEVQSGQGEPTAPEVVYPDGGPVTSSQADLMQELHDEHAAVLWACCVRLTKGDRPRAQDVVQETLLRAWRNPKVLDRSQGSARAWLFTVARNLVIDEWRTRRAQLEVSTAQVPERTPVGDETDRLLQSWVVADALSRLSEDHRLVLVECYYRGRSVAEAARRLDIPEGTIKSRTHYALRALGLELQETGVGP